MSNITTNMACPFARLSINGAERPVGKCPMSKAAKKPEESVNQNQRKHAGEDPSRIRKEETALLAGTCPFGYEKKTADEKDGREERGGDQADDRKGVNSESNALGKCLVGFAKKEIDKDVREQGGGAQIKVEKGETEGSTISAKCPYGYDSVSFKIGPLSCVICRALLFDSSRCMPCRHIYCRGCISRFQDCPLCGVDIEKVESDSEMQELVDRFVEGHARIKRPPLGANGQDDEKGEGYASGNVIYEDISVARGSFLVQQAMRAFQAQNLESARARLRLCVEDSREVMLSGASVTNCSQLGALLGMLGDCCRAMDDSDGAMENYEESVKLLSELPDKDTEVVHALSVSLNKLGDLKYYAEELEAARAFYARALSFRLDGTSDFTTLSSQLLDVAVSLAKVADVDRALGNEQAASEGFQEAVKKLENLSRAKDTVDSMLEKRRLSVLAFLHSQVASP